MAAPSTTYLYGDSTPSPLKTDFIAFLRDAFDFCVQALLCEARLNDAAQRVALLAGATERDVESAESFVAEVSRALDRIPVGGAESLAARCAARMRLTVKELVRAEADAARGFITAESARAQQVASGEREACARAFEALVLRHTLPEASTATRFRVGSDGEYEALSSGSTPYGLTWTVALDIPAGHPLAHAVRLERIVERLEIEAPEEAGWLHKETKMRPQRFERLHLAELAVDASETKMKLRAAPDGSGAGFDVSFEHEGGRIQIQRILEAGGGDAPYEVAGDDVAKLRSLRDDLASMTTDLSEHKRSLVRASLDDKPLQQLDNPRAVVDRLIGNIAPTVQQIAKRTLSPGELVLKRLVRDNQREELFLSKAELEKKMEALPTASRRAFDALELWAVVEPPASKPEQASRTRETPVSTGPKPVALKTPLPKPVPKEEKPAAKEERAPEVVVVASSPAADSVRVLQSGDAPPSELSASSQGPLARTRSSRPPRP
jgi:hypothetical protein